MKNKKMTDILMLLLVYLYIMKMCMIDKEDPVKAWAEYIEGNNYFKNRLNELQIRKMHFQNSLGTDFTIGFKNNIYSKKKNYCNF